ncbi:FAD-dependent monooxygenase [Sphingomicrobium sp. XHP0235]|uniref:NAD(P)/FAD-dependent oxidoreductase n=1 Tax=Sphingomicrobium aquimarinum TaxID=3133971 RepID=UPI0031FE521E
MSAQPIVLGAGPAGCAAAIRLARGGSRPLLIDRHAEAHDPICGGFLSWQTIAALRALGYDPAEDGAAPVRRLALLDRDRETVAPLPANGYGLSRRAMDAALRRLALGAGARLAIDHVRAMDGRRLIGENRSYEGDALFLASGKTDVRGMRRPRSADDPTLGLRFHLDADERLRTLLSDRIELHLFEGGYAGIVMQEGDRANVCLAVRKSLLANAGGDPAVLVEKLAATHPRFAERLMLFNRATSIDSIAAVPYGWRAKATSPSVFRLGDQAAVIPSLAGEGMGIALASAADAVHAYRDGGSAAAQAFQRRFGRRSRSPVTVASALWRIGETGSGARFLRAAASVPMLPRLAMRLSRI